MKIWKALIVLGLICFGLVSALRAQQTPAIQQMENSQFQMELQKPQLLNAETNTETPELYPGENADVGPQRILKMIPRRKLFDVTADSQFFYTGNALLTDSSKISSTLLVNTIQLAYSPDATPLGGGQFAPGIGFRSQWFNYDLGRRQNLSILDFDAQTAFIGGKYTINDWQFYGELDYTRLLSQAHYNEVYHEFMPEAGVRRMFVFNDKTAFTAGYQIAYHSSHAPSAIAGIPTFADVNDRLDNTLSLSLACLVAPKVIVQPFYRIQYTYYPHFSDNTYTGSPGTIDPEAGRNDLINDAGVTLIVQFTKNVTARVFVDDQVQNSDYNAKPNSVEFHNLNVGGGLTLDFRF